MSQERVIAIPKAERRASQEANIAALSIRLDGEGLAAIVALPKNQRFVKPPFAPDWDTTTLKD